MRREKLPGRRRIQEDQRGRLSGVGFFFSSRRRHTRYWRDWSSDVCSSDLVDVESRIRLIEDREPRLAILDETDSGLDIDALKTVAEAVNQLRGPERSFLIVTHYQRLLNYITPDVVHVLADGRIVKTGGPELALELEARGYDWLRDAAMVS